MRPGVKSQQATDDDLEIVTDIMTTAFAEDPVWGGWAFPDPDRERAAAQRREFWRYLLRGAVRFPWVRLTEGHEAAAMWIPPGERELPPEQEDGLAAFSRDLVGGHGATFVEGLEAFEANLPTDEYHLDLLGTHTDHRGKGLGMALLKENLQRIDAEHMPAYLESTNPVNIERYEGVGFTQVGRFTLPGGPTVDTMWREAR